MRNYKLKLNVRVKTKEKFVTHDIVLFISFNLLRFEIKDETEHEVIPSFLAFFVLCKSNLQIKATENKTGSDNVSSVSLFLNTFNFFCYNLNFPIIWLFFIFHIYQICKLRQQKT